MTSCSDNAISVVSHPGSFSLGLTQLCIYQCNCQELEALILSIRRISILLRAEGLLMYGPPLECAATQLHARPEIECADEADDCDGADDIGPRSTPLTSLSERIRVKQQSETQVNRFIYSSLSLSPLPSLAYPLPPFIRVMEPQTAEQDGGRGGDRWGAHYSKTY